jgi:hypothetical protein
MAYSQKTADWVITKAFLHAQRKAIAPAAGTNKYNALLAIVDSMQRLWVEEPNVEWNSLYSKVTLAATLSSSTDTYALDTSIQYLSKKPEDYIFLTNGTTTTEVKVVRPDQLYRYRYENAAAQIGRNLKFSQTYPATDSKIGYSIVVPAYTFPNDIAAGSDPVVVDRPMWLAYMVAAEFARNDSVKSAQYNNLLTLANEVMQKMKEDNQGTQESLSLSFTVNGETWS